MTAEPVGGEPAAVWSAFLEGDNLAVMSTLASESFDLVYIDPPYNTGHDFAFRDDFRDGGRRTTRHEAWTDMMRPRLAEARRLLSGRGAIFVSIDDHEVAYLRLLLDEVFGDEAFVAQIVVNLNPKGRQLGRGFATCHEYLLVYGKDPTSCALDPSSPDTVVTADFPHQTAEGRRFRRLPLRNTNKKFNPATLGTLHYPLWGDPASGRVAIEAFADAVEIWPVFGDGTPAVWRWSPPRVAARPDDLTCRRVHGTRGPRVDVFQLDWLDPGRRKKLRTIWTADEIGSTDSAVAELKALVGPVFETPKPTGLVRRILTTMPTDARVLDFFAGSGTTAHAVALQNLGDGGTRTCLSINSPEPVRPGSPAAAAGHVTVADVTRARLRAVAEHLDEGLWGG